MVKLQSELISVCAPPTPGPPRPAFDTWTDFTEATDVLSVLINFPFLPAPYLECLPSSCAVFRHTFFFLLYQ